MTVTTTITPTLHAARLLTEGATLAVTAYASDGTVVFDGAAIVVAIDMPDGRPVLVAVTASGQEIRVPVGGAA